MKITFSNMYNLDIEQPQPASKFIPDWYKNMESYMGGEKKSNGNGFTPATIKKCMPVFDAITAGYIITLTSDVIVNTKNGKQKFDWFSLGGVDFHPIEQAPDHPYRNEYPYPKWMNPWAIKTPEGYSTLFVQPFHRESVFTIMPGIVDTDKFDIAVNFPMVINDPKFQGIIRKGTPIAQVIPFKREEWEMEINSEETTSRNKNIEKLTSKPFDRYKDFFWNQKKYK